MTHCASPDVACCLQQLQSAPAPDAIRVAVARVSAERDQTVAQLQEATKEIRRLTSLREDSACGAMEDAKRTASIVAEVTMLRAKLEAAESETPALTASVKEANRRLAQEQQRREVAERDIDRLTRQVAAALGERENLTRDAAALRAELSRVSQERTKLADLAEHTKASEAETVRVRPP